MRQRRSYEPKAFAHQEGSHVPLLPYLGDGGAAMIGRTYLERGQPVVVLVRWGKHAARIDGPFGRIDGVALRGGPRNVLIQRAGGDRVVRPFRGLRKLPDPSPPPSRGRDDRDG